MIKFEGKTVICDGNQFEVWQPIKEIIELEDRLIVLFVLTKNVRTGFQNVFCYDKTGKALWRIMPARIELGAIDNLGQFVGIDYNNGELRATDFEGRNYTVDIKTGEPISMMIAK